MDVHGYSELAAYHEAFDAAGWATPDPEACRCGGSGYALSEVDTWHRCPAHFVEGQRHPEDGGDDDCPGVPNGGG